MTDYNRSIRNILLILLVIAAFAVLRNLSNLLIPLVLAGLLTIIDLPLINFLERRKVPRILITLIVSLATIAVLWFVVRMISGTVEQIIQDRQFLARQFNRRIDAAIIWVGDRIPGLNVEFIRSEFNKFLSPGNIAAMIGSLLGSLVSGVGSSTILFLLYYFILLSGAAGYHAYVDYVTGPEESGETKKIWEQTQESISAYMGIKTLVSLATGLVTGVICWAFGLQFALFWGFIAFLMNYIPSIGSMVATVLPVFMAIVQFDSFGIIIALVIALGTTQFAIGSVIDPMLMGSRLRLNTVSVIFGLLFWGYIWGIPGMLLSVPLMVMLRLMLEKSDDFAIVARIMGNPDRSERKKPPLISRLIAKKAEKPDR